MVKRILKFSVLLIIIASVIINLKIENELSEVFSKIKSKNIRNLEHRSNENFSENGIENIGRSLQAELIKMNVDKCDLNVRKDGFLFFQNKVIYIRNAQKCLKINAKYNILKSTFKIERFQIWYQ